MTVGPPEHLPVTMRELQRVRHRGVRVTKTTRMCPESTLPAQLHLRRTVTMSRSTVSIILLYRRISTVRAFLLPCMLRRVPCLPLVYPSPRRYLSRLVAVPRTSIVVLHNGFPPEPSQCRTDSLKFVMAYILESCQHVTMTIECDDWIPGWLDPLRRTLQVTLTDSLAMH